MDPERPCKWFGLSFTAKNKKIQAINKSSATKLKFDTKALLNIRMQ